MNEVKYDQPSATPTPKIAAVGIGGSLTVVLVWAVQSLFNVTIPAEVSAALTTIIGFLSGYMTRDKKPPQAVEEILKAEELKG